MDGKAKPVSVDLGCPGMNQWTILVLGSLRLCLKADFDRLHELANQHRTLRLMLGIAEWDEKTFSLQTLKDNLGLFTPELLARVNQAGLKALLDQVTLPKKGKWSASDEAHEGSESFVTARKTHPAVESGINALEVHGLDICRDHGIDGFKHYIALAVVSWNIQKIGQILRDAERERLARERE